jgi:DNA-binding NtrC family response regulator
MYNTDIRASKPVVRNESRSILVVDDEPDVSFVFQNYLESSGYRVSVYNDPLKALSEFISGRYDLALLDVRMPHMNGFELYQRLHRVDHACKVCFMTAFETYYRTLKEFFPNLDVTCFIRKPVSKEKLLESIEWELIS